MWQNDDDRESTPPGIGGTLMRFLRVSASGIDTTTAHSFSETLDIDAQRDHLQRLAARRIQKVLLI
ncbi:hypothetical protein OU789_07580 [Halocynthiibacter sp. C4]|uniref:hypothetical protein n=1 Tax=Halocynthiibacter sp. C4 TaxID=2992758 RepID=UPI00237AF560|nr:hypothetical protein [Halocynthiibacter sp. C4]MDE0589780.1 hypothetical protein [Halocynthiibacter sp. C4]